MSPPLLVDMNLSPDWVVWFEQRGWSAMHWSTIGDPRAPDRVILGWARAHGQILFTHDLDFGAILASAGAVSPIVVQFRPRARSVWPIPDSVLPRPSIS